MDKRLRWVTISNVSLCMFRLSSARSEFARYEDDLLSLLPKCTLGNFWGEKIGSAPGVVACSRLKTVVQSFSKKRCEKRAGAEERPRASYFRFPHFKYVPTILSESLAQATASATGVTPGSHARWLRVQVRICYWTQGHAVSDTPKMIARSKLS